MRSVMAMTVEQPLAARDESVDDGVASSSDADAQAGSVLSEASVG